MDVRRPRLIRLDCPDGPKVRLPSCPGPNLLVHPAHVRPTKGWFRTKPGVISTFESTPWKRIWIMSMPPTADFFWWWIWTAREVRQAEEIVFGGLPLPARFRGMMEDILGPWRGPVGINPPQRVNHDSWESRPQCKHWTSDDWTGLAFDEVRIRRPWRQWGGWYPTPRLKGGSDEVAFLSIRSALRDVTLKRLRPPRLRDFIRLLALRGTINRHKKLHWHGLVGEPIFPHEVPDLRVRNVASVFTPTNVNDWYKALEDQPFVISKDSRSMPWGIIGFVDMPDVNEWVSRVVNHASFDRRRFCVLGLPVSQNGWGVLKTVVRDYRKRGHRLPIIWLPNSDLETMWERYLRLGYEPPNGCAKFARKYNARFLRVNRRWR